MQSVQTAYYQQDPEATAEAFDREGWFNTGDLGFNSAAATCSRSRNRSAPASSSTIVSPPWSSWRARGPRRSAPARRRAAGRSGSPRRSPAPARGWPRSRGGRRSSRAASCSSCARTSTRRRLGRGRGIARTIEAFRARERWRGAGRGVLRQRGCGGQCRLPCPRLASPETSASSSPRGRCASSPTASSRWCSWSRPWSSRSSASLDSGIDAMALPSRHARSATAGALRPAARWSHDSRPHGAGLAASK